MEKDFVEYTEALALKELGFDEPCLDYFANGNPQNSWTISYNSDDLHRPFESVARPTYSQCYRFFREKHNLITYIGWVYKKTKGIDWFFNIKGIEMINNNILPHNEIRFNTYEEAELECLKKLIEIVKK